MKSFFDSSALAKRYIKEEGTDRLNGIFDKSQHILVSVICLPEIFSALNRLKRQNHILEPQYQQVKQSILKEIDGFDVCALNPKVIGLSLSLLEQYELRAMDAIHLACAKEMKAKIFVSSDVKQISAAREMKFETLQI